MMDVSHLSGRLRNPGFWKNPPWTPETEVVVKVSHLDIDEMFEGTALVEVENIEYNDENNKVVLTLGKNFTEI